MNYFVAFAGVVFLYAFLVKLFGLDSFFFKVNPPTGKMLNTFTKYTGADSVYSTIAKSGTLGEEKRESELEKEFVMLKNELDV